jgi:hypothetical protein
LPLRSGVQSAAAPAEEIAMSDTVGRSLRRTVRRLAHDLHAADGRGAPDLGGVTCPVVTTIEGALVFAGIPLAVVGVVFGAVFSTTPKPPRDESKKTKKS